MRTLFEENDLVSVRARASVAGATLAVLRHRRLAPAG